MRAIDRLQVEFGARKLILGRSGDVFLDGSSVRPTGRNLVSEVLRDTPPLGEQPYDRFVALLESIPNQYIRFFPETRLGSPFVVRVTEEGRRYLRY